MQITSRSWGVTSQGGAVTCYTMENAGGMRLSVLDYGCIITQLWVRDRHGQLTDVALGYDDLASYETDCANFGAVVGRYANRIKGAAFDLNGQTFHLCANDGANHLHGVLGHRLFKTCVGDNSLRFTYHSPDGEEGFPGAVDFAVTYSLDDNDVLRFHYEAVSSRDTVLNLTNHTYFNLAGHASGAVDDQLLQIAADSVLETADDVCPTGHILAVKGAMDFRRLCHIGQGFPMQCEQMELVGGYDHCYILRPEAVPQVLAYSPKTGISLQIATTQPAVQFYSGNFLDDGLCPGKGGCRYVRRGGFALETQHYPCAPNYPQFPATVVRAGERYQETTLWQFRTAEKL